MASLDPVFNPSIFRKDYPMILAQNRQLASIEPVRLQFDAAGYEAGRVVARNTVDGLYYKYNNAGASGLDTAAGVLFEDHPIEDFDTTTGGTTAARCIFGGEVYQSLCVGLDAPAIVDLKARTIIDATGVSVLKF